MEKKRKGDKRPYAERLLPKSKIRYEKKLLLIDGNDPYELPTNVWSVNPDDLPEITYITIVNYFVLGKSRYTSEPKSLESYKTFVAGWVRDIRCYQPLGCPNVVVYAKVLHSQRLNEAPLTPWVIVTADGSNILSAHCTCKAGIGETCSHVGALTFACDAFTTTKEKATCTGVKAYWKVPQGIRGVKPAPAYKIDFSSARAKKDRLNKFIQDADAVVPEVAHQQKLPYVAEPSSDELATFFSELKLTPGTPNILKLLPQYCDEYATENLVPATLQRLFDANCEGMTLEKLQEHCRTIPVQVTEERCCKIEEATRLQSKSDVWFASRAGRITASNLYDACHTDPHNPSRSLVRKIVYPEEHKFSNCATDWGKENEAVALDDY